MPDELLSHLSARDSRYRSWNDLTHFSYSLEVRRRDFPLAFFPPFQQQIAVISFAVIDISHSSRCCLDKRHGNVRCESIGKATRMEVSIDLSLALFTISFYYDVRAKFSFWLPPVGHSSVLLTDALYISNPRFSISGVAIGKLHSIGLVHISYFVAYTTT